MLTGVRIAFGEHGGQVVFIGVFSLQPLASTIPPAQPSDNDAGPWNGRLPHNISGAELTAAVYVRALDVAGAGLLCTGASVCVKSLGSVLSSNMSSAMQQLLSRVCPPSAGSQPYTPVAGLADVPVMSDGRGRYQVEWPEAVSVAWF